MLYTLFILICGVYLGQEYTDIPKIHATMALVKERWFKKRESDKHYVEKLYETFFKKKE
jgi:hypothetical protein